MKNEIIEIKEEVQIGEVILEKGDKIEVMASFLKEEKRYNTMQGVGKAKYVVNYHDGEKTHRDGSEFFDIATFSNKKDLDNFVKTLEHEGYIYSR